MYRGFSYYQTREQLDAEALRRLRVVLDHDLFDLAPPDDDEAEAIDRALLGEREARS